MMIFYHPYFQILGAFMEVTATLPPFHPSMTAYVALKLSHNFTYSLHNFVYGHCCPSDLRSKFHFLQIPRLKLGSYLSMSITFTDNFIHLKKNFNSLFSCLSKTYLFQEQAFYGCLLNYNSGYFITQRLMYHKIKKKILINLKEVILIYFNYGSCSEFKIWNFLNEIIFHCFRIADFFPACV